MQRDMCIHQCVDDICFQKSYGDLKGQEENPYTVKQEEAIQREVRKNKFMACFEGPRKLKSYAELRSDCSRWSCGEIDKDAKMFRDQCIHECMSASCYYNVYGDIDGIVPDYPNSKTADEDRELRKQYFKECYENLQGNKTNIPKQKKGIKTYNELRSDCSAKTCKQIEKTDKFGRDLCLHKCVSAECYDMAYGDIDVEMLSYETHEEEEEDRVVRRQIFVQCVEADIPKNAEERKAGCISRGTCKDLEKNSLQREICLNECIHPECFEGVYSQIKGKLGELQFEQDEQKQDLQRQNLKTSFIECVEQNLPENRKSKQFKTYAKKRNECAPICSHIDKENTMERDLCIHKCINVNCYYENYGEVNLESLLEQTLEQQEDERENLKQNFIECAEKDLPKEIKARKYQRRQRTCQWKYAFQVPYLNQTDADELIFKCINEFCFFYIYDKYIEGQNLTEVYNSTTENEKEVLIDNFIDCVETGGPKLIRTYRELRTECINKQCFLIDKDKQLERDMCVHQCIDLDCFKNNYGDYTRSMPNYQYKKEAKADRMNRKELFKQCIQEKVNIKDDHDEDQEIDSQDKQIEQNKKSDL